MTLNQNTELLPAKSPEFHTYIEYGYMATFTLPHSSSKVHHGKVCKANTSINDACIVTAIALDLGINEAKIELQGWAVSYSEVYDIVKVAGGSLLPFLPDYKKNKLYKVVSQWANAFGVMPQTKSQLKVAEAWYELYSEPSYTQAIENLIVAQFNLVGGHEIRDEVDQLANMRGEYKRKPVYEFDLCFSYSMYYIRNEVKSEFPFITSCVNDIPSIRIRDHFTQVLFNRGDVQSISFIPELDCIEWCTIHPYGGYEALKKLPSWIIEKWFDNFKLLPRNQSQLQLIEIWYEEGVEPLCGWAIAFTETCAYTSTKAYANGNLSTHISTAN